MSFKVGDQVSYGVYGVCQIEEICLRSPMNSAKKTQYYQLKPSNSPSTLFIPVNSSSLTSQMKQVLSKTEIDDLIKSSTTSDWLENKTDRQNWYKRVLSQGTRTELIGLIKTIYLSQQAADQEQKRLPATDLDAMKKAGQLIQEEFSTVLNIKKSAVIPFITSTLD